MADAADRAGESTKRVERKHSPASAEIKQRMRAAHQARHAARRKAGIAYRKRNPEIKPPAQTVAPRPVTERIQKKRRGCLRCRCWFLSDGNHNRLCKSCGKADSPGPFDEVHTVSRR